jgi:hypothetical protein
MRRTVIIVRTALAAIAFSAPWVATAVADPLSDWLASLSQCSPAKPLRLGVIGFEPGVLDTSAEQIRFAIQAELDRSNGVQTAAVRDVGLLQGLQEDVLRRVPPETASRQLREAFLGVDALVFFRVPERRDAAVRFRLHALFPDNLSCTKTSEPVERPLVASRGDLDSEIAGAVQRLLDGGNPPVSAISVCPFEMSGRGFSSCAPILTDRVLRHLDMARRTATAVVRNHQLTITRSDPGRCTAGPDGASAHGRIALEGRDKLVMHLEFRRGGDVLSTTGRTPIFPQELGCEARLLPFLDYIQAEARLSEPQLSVQATKSVFTSRRDVLGMDLKAGANLLLYCWIIGTDETAYVALPVRGAEASASIQGGSTRRYPDQFGGLTMLAPDKASEDLFGCFGFASPLPRQLHEEWVKHAPTASDGAKEMERDDILRLIEKMRAQPLVVEAYTRIVVR